MKRTAQAKELPVRPGVEGRVRTAYVDELAKVSTADELRAFASKWRFLYFLELTKDMPDPEPAEERLIDGTFDADVALACIAANRRDVCAHMKEGTFCEGAALLLPNTLLALEHLAGHFFVGTDLIIRRLAGDMR